MQKARPILVSYPKSGSNWVRYAIEYFSGGSTPGSKRKLLHPNRKNVIDRTHFLNKPDRLLFLRHTGDERARPHKSPGKERLGNVKKTFRRLYLERFKSMILLLRDPCELYVRVGATNPLALRGYFSNILVFDRAKQPKIVKYYDDIVADFEHVRDILDFLDIQHRDQEFNVEEHRKRSLELYKQGPDAPASEEDLHNFRYHSRRLDRDVRAAVADLGWEVLGAERAERYLGRFDLHGRSASTR